MIVFFSGTGNSREVARRIADALGHSSFEITGKAAINPAEYAPLVMSPHEEDVVWVFPTYSWGVPPVVERFIKNIKVEPSFAAARHWMVTTCGDDMGYADRQFNLLVGSRGWNPAARAFSVIMPNTYVLMRGFDVDSSKVEREKLDDMSRSVESVVRCISGDSSETCELKRGLFPRFKTYVINPWFKRHDMSPKPFHHSDACTLCGLCARTCPLENISMKESGPVWKEDCALCLRCYHICPSHAVAYGNITKRKGQYKEFLRIFAKR